MGCLRLVLPGRQQGLIKRADGCLCHCVAPQSVIALLRLVIGNACEGLPINSEYSQEIADPLMRLMEGVKMQ
jgi:hypothetical protein